MSSDGTIHIAKGSFYDEDLYFFLTGRHFYYFHLAVHWFSSYSVKTQYWHNQCFGETKSDMLRYEDERHGV